MAAVESAGSNNRLNSIVFFINPSIDEGVMGCNKGEGFFLEVWWGSSQNQDQLPNQDLLRLGVDVDFDPGSLSMV